MSKKWDKRFLEIAEHVSTWSRDPSTKCGSAITRGKFIVSLGFNGFPAGTSDDPEIYADRPRKLRRVAHSELNAILSAKQDLTGCTIYVHPFTPCAQCSVAIIQSGITRVVTKTPSAELVERWGDSITESLAMFAEAGVAYEELIA